MRKLCCLALLLLLAYCAAAMAEVEWTYMDGALTDYAGAYGDVVVPGAVDGVEMTALGGNLFYDKAELTSVAIPEGIAAIGSYAFYSCENLKSAALPESLEAIADNAFCSCEGLTELRIPAAVGYIGDNAFALCSGMTGMTFEGEAPVVGDGAFSGMDNVTFYVPDDRLDAYRAILPAGSAVLGSGRDAAPHAYAFADYEFDPATGTLTSYAGRAPIVVIPPEIDGVPVKAIGSEAFYYNQTAYRVEIPEGVEIIGKKAFARTWNMVAVSLPSTLRTIDDEAFYRYQGYSIALPEGLQIIGDSAFYNSRLRNLVVPEGVRSIGNSAFEKAPYLYELRLPSTIERVGDRAFAETIVHYIRMDGGDMPEFGADVFAGNPQERLTDVDIAWNSSRAQWERAAEVFADLGLANVTVWRLNPSAMGLAIPAGAASAVYGEYADGRLVSVGSDYPDVTVYGRSSDGTKIYAVGDGCFKDSAAIRSFYPHHCNWFTTIGREAFADSSLAYVDLFDSITTIGERAFANCRNLTELTIPDSVTFIGEDAFAGCTGLASVTVLCDPALLPEGSFAGVPNVVLSADASDEAVEALSAKLGRAWYNPVLRQGETARALEAMPNTPTDASLFEFDSDEGMITAYIGKDVDVVIPREIDGVPVRAIRANAFDSCRDYSGTDVSTNQTAWVPLRSIVVPETVDVIEDMAFSYCQQLEYFVCYAPLETTGISTFLRCTGLKDVSFVNGVRRLDNYLFEACGCLESVYYGDHLEAIGQSCFVDSGIGSFVVDAKTVDNFAFGRCWNLSELHFTDRVKSAAVGAVNDCISLTRICIESDSADFLPGDGMAAEISGYVTVCVPETMPDEQAAYVEKRLCIWDEYPSTITIERGVCSRESALPVIPDWDALPESDFVPAPVIADAPEETLIPEPVGAEGEPYFGTWYGVQLVMDDFVMNFADYGSTMELTLGEDGIASLFDGDATERTLWSASGSAATIDGEAACIDESGNLVIEEDGGQMVFSRAKPAETPDEMPDEIPDEMPDETPADEGDAPEGAGSAGIDFETKYVCVNADVSGVTLDAALLGGEYSLVLHENGTVNLIMGDVEMVPMPWKAIDNGIEIDYEGMILTVTFTETGFDFDFFSSMNMHFVKGGA